MTKETKPTGTQSIERAIDLLKLLATRGTFGWGLTDLARRSGLDKATVHRILGCLESQRLVHRDPREHRYFPGPMLMEMGLSVAGHQPFIDEGKALIARLSQRVRGVSFFYLRSGTEFVVAGRVQFTVSRGMLNEVGFRRPLMMSAGGVAMLLAMSAQERDAVVAENVRDMEETATPRIDRFTRMLDRSLTLGYSCNLGDVAAGINSFGVPILDAAGEPVGSVSIAGDPAQFPESAGEKLAELLRHESAELSARAAKLPIGAAHASARHVQSAVQASNEKRDDKRDEKREGALEASSGGRRVPMDFESDLRSYGRPATDRPQAAHRG
ncbi:N/A [soil metagenome]